MLMSRGRFEKKYILSQFENVNFRSDYNPKKVFNVYKVIKMIKRRTASKHFTDNRVANIKRFFDAAGVTFKS